MAFVLGAYPTALHVRWRQPRRDGSVSPQLVQQVAGFVSEKSGGLRLGEDRSVGRNRPDGVGVVLPKVLAFAKDKLGGGDGKEGGGLLGGLF